MDSTVRLWDVDSGAPLKTLDASAGVITDLALSADGGRVAVSSMDGTGTPTRSGRSRSHRTATPW
ncbi:hypothetical protein WMF45_05570 [Sorangium sp. So ce448]|uniref:hypothetical protein n=1 Tax=Sorangium sp. So ce448 TaxID=3133314 RepID=UPI003F638FBA